ncbi:hypothetical protein PGTUg99_018225 [Puccinia graminis f. sp. tritici]|uniref:CCHC-type domain-containing protein n=1 Tax=Puccinia graminis f. sp. tritici TaxID=56615 RepID=A0A5B0S344_PUCGR|nr:hypothetical protein PGTUg99_018225 [Puccinia graminis f. sp. tritici]
MSQSAATANVTPRNKFLQQPGIYKQDVNHLAADGSNFKKWKRGLNQVILLTLGHPNFFDKAENYTKLSNQEQTCLLYFIQITIHDELASLVDQHTKGTAAYDAIQTNFQGTVRFRQMELIDKQLDFKISGPNTEPSQLPGLFNKIFDVFSGLHKVGAGLTPLVESLVLQAIVPPPSTMSCSQLFQNISLQLGTKPNVLARDIQTIITSAYGESLRFYTTTSQNVSVFRTWPNQPNNANPWNTAPSSNFNSWGTTNQQQPRNARQNPIPQSQQNSSPQSNNNNRGRQQNVGRPGHPTLDDIAATINNIRRGNRGPSDNNMLASNPCLYCGAMGHWRSSCPILRRDANLQQPKPPLQGCPASGFARQAAPPNNPSTGSDQNPAI